MLEQLPDSSVSPNDEEIPAVLSAASLLGEGSHGRPLQAGDEQVSRLAMLLDGASSEECLLA